MFNRKPPPETHDQESMRLSEQAALAAKTKVKGNNEAAIRSSSISHDAPSDAEIAASTDRHLEEVETPSAAADEEPRALVSLAAVQRSVIAGLKKANDLSGTKAASLVKLVNDEIAANWPDAVS